MKRIHTYTIFWPGQNISFLAIMWDTPQIPWFKLHVPIQISIPTCLPISDIEVVFQVAGRNVNMQCQYSFPPDGYATPSSFLVAF